MFIKKHEFLQKAYNINSTKNMEFADKVDSQVILQN